jgi:hypothetical protein
MQHVAVRGIEQMLELHAGQAFDLQEVMHSRKVAHGCEGPDARGLITQCAQRA